MVMGRIVLVMVVMFRMSAFPGRRRDEVEELRWEVVPSKLGLVKI